ncbi:hypothetical protein P3T37_001509 [Kitasatospora sp. MAA4]|uniref:hypothetical protein n=1 Tax=Kitasatospora sp. MAA4 TaxID=3035093 RepID=UPI00247702FE|nr:hypothetical protein [Kitasatospora sp. MAA4]MDH6132124.1 hypothetical protein [Kitasatospora sp. MAA4]
MVRRLATTVAVCCTAGSLLGAAPAAQRADAADLKVVQMNPAPAAVGQKTLVRGFVTNAGRAAAPAFTVAVLLPAGVTPEGPYFPTNCAAAEATRTVTCTFRAGLRAQESATAQVPVRIDPGASGVLTGGTVTVSSPGDPNASTDTQPFEIRVTD